MLEGIKGVSTYANDVDQAFVIVTVITLFLFVVTIGSMLFFLFKYRASKHAAHETKNIKHYTPIEIAWTVIPTILMMVVFYFGLESLRVQRTMPKDTDAINIKVTAQRWFWSFEYENGKKSAELYVPINSNIKLIMTAPENDVLHSFYVPAFRAKEDIIPGQTTKLWFNATTEGKFDIQCAEYCGTRHSYMRSFVHVLKKDAYEQWINPKEELSKEKEEPKAMDLMAQYGCIGCHSFDGTTLVGPSLKDIYNKEVSVLSDGKLKTIKRDELYLKNSILTPNTEVVEGFSPNLMPSFQGVIQEKELNTIINFLKGEKVKKAPAKIKKINGKEVISNNGCIGCHSIDGSRVVGPSFKDIFNRKTKVIKEGKTIELISDETYLRNSIINPSSEVVESYQNIMPPFKGVLTEDEINAVIEYFKTLKE